MVNLVEILFGIAIGSGVVALLAFVQSKSGGEREAKYRARMRSAGIASLTTLVLALIGEVLIRL